MVAYRFEIDDADGTVAHAESGPIALGREGHDGWVAGGTIVGDRVTGGRRGRTPREAVLKALLEPGTDPTPADLAVDVFDTVVAQTQSFEYDDWIGPDLAYLLGAILKGTGCAWPADRPLVRLLRGAYPDPGHPVWRSIDIEPEEEDGAEPPLVRKSRIGSEEEAVPIPATNPRSPTMATSKREAQGQPTHELTAEAVRIYVTGGGNHCPFCNDEDISGSSVEIDSGYAWQEVDCSACGRSWHDLYTLTGIDTLDAQVHYKDTLDGTGPTPIEKVLAEDAKPGEPTRPVELYVGVAHDAGVSGSWQMATIQVPRRVPADRLGEAAIHLLQGRLEREGVTVTFVGVHSIPEAVDDRDEREAG
jgi:hypothetical protein